MTSISPPSHGAAGSPSMAFYDYGQVWYAQYVSNSVPTPEPATLGLLAIGGLGVLRGAMRHRKGRRGD